MAESEEELKSLLMKVKEESEKFGLKLNIWKTKIMASGPITSWEIDGETVSDFILGWKRLWCWEGLWVEGEGDNRGWDGWMASLTRWMWVWVNSGSWWWTGRPAVLQFMGSQRVRHNLATELNWTPYLCKTLHDPVFLFSLIATVLAWAFIICWLDCCLNFISNSYILPLH